MTTNYNKNNKMLVIQKFEEKEIKKPIKMDKRKVRGIATACLTGILITAGITTLKLKDFRLYKNLKNIELPSDSPFESYNPNLFPKDLFPEDEFEKYLEKKLPPKPLKPEYYFLNKFQHENI